MLRRCAIVWSILLSGSITVTPAAAQVAAAPDRIPDDATTAAIEGGPRILPPIVNGDFEHGLFAWTWDFEAEGAGIYEADGFPVIVPLPHGDLSPDNNHALQLTTWANVDGLDGVRSEVDTNLHIEQRFLYTPGLLPYETEDFVVASASVGFGIEMSRGTSATLRVMMRIYNLTTGSTCSVAIQALRIEAPCNRPVAMIGMLPQRQYEVRLDDCDAEIEDELEIRFSTTVDAAADGRGSFVRVASCSLLDDVALIRRPPSPPHFVSGRETDVLTYILPAESSGDGTAFDMLSLAMRPDRLSANALRRMGAQWAPIRREDPCGPRIEVLHLD